MEAALTLGGGEDGSMYRLEMIGDHGPGEIFSLIDGSTMSVGRQGSNDVVLDDGSVSRSHCLIYIQPGSVEIEDLDSTNGVSVRGERITARSEIRINEELKIGSLRFVLRKTDERPNADETFVARISPRPKTDG